MHAACLTLHYEVQAYSQRVCELRHTVHLNHAQISKHDYIIYAAAATALRCMPYPHQMQQPQTAACQG
jgi:hypothetical protein